MLWNLFKPSGIFGVVTAVAAIFLAITAIASWLKDEAVSENNLVWQLKLQKANQTLKDEVAERNLKLLALEKKLAEVDMALAAAAELNRKALEKQRATVPLSEACSACRIPNDRLWLRKPPRVGEPAGSPAEGNQGGSGGAGDQTPTEKTSLPGPGEKGLHGPRAGIGAGLSRGIRVGG